MQWRARRSPGQGRHCEQQPCSRTNGLFSPTLDPSSFLAVDETLQTRVKAGNAKIRHGQEGHWRQHPLLEVANTSLRSVAAVNDHRIQVSR